MKGVYIMKSIIAFDMVGCPYCANAHKAIQELINENPTFKSIPIQWVDDANAGELFKTHPYTYVPNMWFDTNKQYEAHPGETYEETKGKIKAVLENALKAI